MDLPQLRAFVEIATTGNLTRAANNLCISQPALSSRIKSLEDEIGLQLFERNAKGMVLTRPGETLYQEATQTLDAARAFVNRARSMSTDLHGHVRLGTISEPVALRLGEFLSSMLVDCPNVTISITQAISGVVIDRILGRELDAGYVIGRTDEPNLECIELIPVRFLVVAPAAWNDKIRSASWKDLGGYPWVGAPPKCSYNTIMQELFAREGIQPRRLAEADQENMLRSLVARGVGVSVLREDQALAAQAVGELCVWPHGHTQSVLCFIQRADLADGAVNAVMKRVVSQVWSSALTRTA